MNRNLLRWPLMGLLLLIFLEMARVYFIMPMPGSQLDNEANLSRVGVAYWLHQYVPWLRAMLLLLLITPVFNAYTKPMKTGYRWLITGLIGIYAGTFYLVNQRMMADHMFLQPTTKRMVSMGENKIPTTKLVLGVVEKGEARAYPLQLIGYHHQVRDTVGGKPIMVTYCTVCRTGRVFDPVLDGKPVTFRLVGMDHFNAMFEDETTGSWWRQATGEAIMGPLRGRTLTELPARQMTLAEWAAEHPNTLVMQPDPAFREETDSLATYDTGVRRGKLTRRDSASWKAKSWVVGIEEGKAAKAVDWNELVKKRIINSQVGRKSVVITLAPDQQTFRVFNRLVNSQLLTFRPLPAGEMSDSETGSVWNRSGLATSGTLAGQQLKQVQAYQEFWHSWQSFHPATTR